MWLDFENEDLYQQYNADGGPRPGENLFRCVSTGRYERINRNFKEMRFEAFFAKVKVYI